jgi:hypothetical protein
VQPAQSAANLSKRALFSFVGAELVGNSLDARLHSRERSLQLMRDALQERPAQVL